ncbi:MAG: flagellar biosynthesis regulator FlaF [Devosia sp.]
MAYQQVGKQTVNPRELEAGLLSKSASNLQRIRDDWDSATRDDLAVALRFNRRLWTVFMTSVTSPDSTLPQDVRQNVANLGIFIAKHMLQLQIEPAARKLDVLININRQLAAGLRATPPV